MKSYAAAALVAFAACPAAAKVEAARPDLTALVIEQPSSDEDAPCLESGLEAQRIVWIIRAEDGSVITIATVEVRRRC